MPPKAVIGWHEAEFYSTSPKLGSSKTSFSPFTYSSVGFTSPNESFPSQSLLNWIALKRGVPPDCTVAQKADDVVAECAASRLAEPDSAASAAVGSATSASGALALMSAA